MWRQYVNKIRYGRLILPGSKIKWQGSEVLVESKIGKCDYNILIKYINKISYGRLILPESKIKW